MAVKRTLQERCETYERTIRRRKLATEAELAQYRPARSASLFAWAYYYAQCIRFLGREEWKETDSAGADGRILAALNAEPIKLTIGWGEEARDVGVYPKSLEALLQLHARDEAIKFLTARYEVLAGSGSAGPERLELLERAGAEIAYQTQLCCWTLCHPEPGLPFGAGEDRPTIPDVWRAIDPWDVLRINQGHLEVNAGRLQALEQLVEKPKAGKPTSRPSWSVFVGTLAMKWKEDPKKLMRDVPLGSLLATVQLATPAIEEEAAAAAVGAED